MSFFKRWVAWLHLCYFYLFELVWYAFMGLWLTEKNYFYKNKVLLYFFRYHLPTLTNILVVLHLLPCSLWCILISFVFFLLAQFFIYKIYVYILYLVFINLCEMIGALGLAGIMYFCMMVYACYTRFKRERKNIEEIVKTWDINQDSTFLKPKNIK